jgi:hypothetical protein
MFSNRSELWAWPNWIGAAGIVFDCAPEYGALFDPCEAGSKLV